MSRPPDYEPSAWDEGDLDDYPEREVDVNDQVNAGEDPDGGDDADED